MVSHYLITVLILVFAVFLYFVLVVFFVFRPPRNNPREIIKELEEGKLPPKIKVVFVGDSITHGNMSVNYINFVKERLNPDRYLFINAGINADTTYDVLLRLDDIIALHPDIVTILIGTNDVLQSLGLSPLKVIRDILKHATYSTPTKDSFRQNLIQIVERLLSQTNATIALCSLPPLTEDPSSRPFQETIAFSEIIKDIAQKYSLSYLPVNETMRAYLSEHPSSPSCDLIPSNVEKIYLKELFLRKSFDEISHEYGFELLVDNIHLNSKGAKIVADLIVDFISKFFT